MIQTITISTKTTGIAHSCRTAPIPKTTAYAPPKARARATGSENMLDLPAYSS